jgi:hypothetical protein
VTADPFDPKNDRTLEEGESDLGEQLVQQRAAAAARTVVGDGDDMPTLRPAIRPAARVVPPGSSVSFSAPRQVTSSQPVRAALEPAPTPPSRRGGIVVHRASDAAPAPGAPPVVEALQALKPAPPSSPSLTSSSFPSLKPDVAEALAGLKPAAKTAASLSSLPPSTLPPGRVATRVPSSSLPADADVSDLEASSVPAGASDVRSVTIPSWAVRGASVAALVLVTVGVGIAVQPEQEAAVLPPVVARPELPITALKCETLKGAERTLECGFSPTTLANMSGAERDKRLRSTTSAALALGYTRVVLVDRTGTWRVLRTDDAPVATMATALAEASRAPAPSTPPPSRTPNTAAKPK